MNDLIVVPRLFTAGTGAWIGFSGFLILVLLVAWRRAARQLSTYQGHLCEAIESLVGNETSSRTITRLDQGWIGDAAKWWVDLSAKIREGECDLQNLRRAARGDVIQEEPAGVASDVLGGIRILQAEVRNLRDTLGDRERQVAFYQGWHETLAAEAKRGTDSAPDLQLPDERYINLRNTLIGIRALWSRINDLQSQLNAELANPGVQDGDVVVEKETWHVLMCKAKGIDDGIPGPQGAFVPDGPAGELLMAIQERLSDEGIERERNANEASKRRLEARIEQAATSRDSALDRVAALEKDLEATRDERDRLRADVARLEELKEWPGVTTFLEQASIALEAKACLDFPELLKLLVQVVARKNQLDREVQMVKLARTVSKTEKKQREGDAQFRNRVALELEPFFVRCHEAFFKHSSHVEHQMLQKAVQELRDRFPGTAYRPDEFAVLDSGEIVDCPELEPVKIPPGAAWASTVADAIEKGRRVGEGWHVPPEPEFVKLARDMRGYGWLERFRRATDENQIQQQSPFHANQVASAVDKLLDAIEAAVKNAPAMVYTRGPSAKEQEEIILKARPDLRALANLRFNEHGAIPGIKSVNPLVFAPMMVGRTIDVAIQKAKELATKAGEPCHLIFNGSCVAVYADDDTAFARWQLGRKDYQTLLDSHVSARESKLEARVRELEGKLKSAIEQVKLLEDLRDKMSADSREREKRDGEVLGYLWALADGEEWVLDVPKMNVGETNLAGRIEKLQADFKKASEMLMDPLVHVKLVPAKSFAIEVGKCYLAQNSVKWWIVAEAKDANGKTIYSGIARELMRHPPPMAWFYGDGQAVHSMNSSLQSEVK